MLLLSLLLVLQQAPVRAPAPQQPRPATADTAKPAPPTALPLTEESAPLTTQFFIEDHALRHSFHHLAKIRATLGR